MIEVLVGMIAAGKSTWCNKRAEEGWIIINDDAIVSAIHGGNYTLYDKSLKLLYKIIENTILQTAVAMGKNVVIDRGLDIDPKSRARWVCLARSLDVPIKAVCFERFSPEVHAQRRFKSDNRERSYEFWLEVANAHSKRFYSPVVEEGFSDVEIKKWDSK